MTEYIEREAVKESIGFVKLHCVAYGENKSLLDTINEIPAADVVPVRHGRWIVSEDEYGICATEFTCSNCKESYCTSELTDEEFLKSTHYCPNCGAKMDEDVAE